MQHKTEISDFADRALQVSRLSESTQRQLADERRFSEKKNLSAPQAWKSHLAEQSTRGTSQVTYEHVYTATRPGEVARAYPADLA
jgi:hypothetical protein